jgi:hypothetical protein
MISPSVANHKLYVNVLKCSVRQFSISYLKKTLTLLMCDTDGCKQCAKLALSNEQYNESASFHGGGDFGILFLSVPSRDITLIPFGAYAVSSHTYSVSSHTYAESSHTYSVSSHNL